MGYYWRKKRVFASNNEIEDVVVTVGGKRNMLSKVGAVKER